MAVAPPPPRLPPLPHLVAFEATVRRGGYAAAALSVGRTPGALRAKVRALEAGLGVALFQPHAKGLAVTAQGAELADALTAGLRALHRAVAPLAPDRADPPWSALPPFEAALRCGGFAAAAAELGQTPRAIAASVRRVEDWAGRPVFARHARGTTPLAPAVAVAPALGAALHDLSEAVRACADAQVRIATLPAIAQLWLAPRLAALRAALPGVRLSITALESMPQTKTAPFDLALFLAPAGGSVVAQDALLPVCAPTLVAAPGAARDLAGLPRLTDSTWHEDWRRWIQAAAPDLPVPSHDARHSLYALAVEEALAGAGVLIGHTVLIGRWLQSGALIAPFGPPVPCTSALRLFRLRRGAPKSGVEGVARWIETAGDRESDGTDAPARTGDPQIHNLVL